jgi:hypothetical protein
VTRHSSAIWILIGSLGFAQLGVADPAAAEVRRIEEVGAVPIRNDGRGGVGVRDEAKQAALQEAVKRVARSFLMEVDPPIGSDAGGEEIDLEKVLGKRMVPYTTRFRVLEDRGERPAMFAEKGKKREYVVVVEVFVDADRVEQRLIDAGLLIRDPRAGEVTRVELEARGLEAYGALAALRALLIEQAGATAAVPQRFEQGVAVLDVELEGGDGDPSELTEQLMALGPPELLIRTLEVGAHRAVVDVTWRPSSDQGGAGRGAAPGARK